MSDAFLDQLSASEQRFKANEERFETKARMLEEHHAAGDAVGVKLDSAERLMRRLDSLGLEGEINDMMSSEGQLNVLERIMGENELSSVSLIEGGALAVRTIARILIKDSSGFTVGFGTGSMISPRLLMTNNHVLRTAEIAAASIAEFDYITGFRGDYQPIAFRLQPDVFFQTDIERDFTIIAVEPENSDGVLVASRGYTRLIRGSGKAVVGERVNILQHPGGQRLQVAFVDNKIIDITDDFLQYRADTMPGSSGAPVYNQQGELAALHHAGTPERKNGKIVLRDGTPWSGSGSDKHLIKWISNEGVRISCISQFVDKLRLTGNHKALWDQCFERPNIVDVWGVLGQAATDRPSVPSSIGEFHRPPTNVPAMLHERDGSISYFFRVNFGPAGTSHSRSGPCERRLASGAGITHPAPVQSAQTSGAKDSSSSSRHGSDTRRRELFDAAERHFRRHQHLGPYWDKEKDQANAKAYYSEIDWSASSEPLYNDLNKLLVRTHTGRFSYAKARHSFLYPAVDLHEDGKLRHIYSGRAFDAIEAIASELALALRVAAGMGLETTPAGIEAILERDEIWDRLEENEAQPPFNCEHVVPQSWFRKQRPMKEDLHHLFTCESRCNSFRGNLPYYQFGLEEEATRGECGQSDSRGFEPENGKGAVARATMYFLLRYKDEVGDGDHRREMPKNRARLLMHWHKSHPVTDYERHRNQVIAEVQGNRNPFIDNEDFATETLLKIGFA